MRLTPYNRLIGIALVVTAGACVEPYPAPDIADDLSILVVDGFVNGSDGVATVRLTHTVKLNEDSGSPAEEGATVSIKTETGDSFTLIEQDSGRYTAEGLVIDANKQYQLYIRTKGGEEYISDYVTVKDTPPIDSVTWRPEGDGVSVMVNTHDLTGQTKYYRWEYVETWEYESPYVSLMKVVNKQALYRDATDFIYICYRTIPSTKIFAGSSVRLQEDVIRDFPLNYLPRMSGKISVLYSMMVSQRAIERAEYEYWQDLQRVTEGLGGLFDSQPYEIVGNVHHVSNPSTPVLGYFGAGFVQKQRMFLSYYDLPKELQKRPYHGCQLDTVCVLRTPSAPFNCANDIPGLPNNTPLISPLYSGPTVVGYTMSSQYCSDCRQQGGVLEKPDFWP
ncbi:MAG TPA: DUF4249 domain-containing protein [Chryseolinea sp.]|nr:DUF4249 domain-containing protein [Chryseolinea sp.]